MPANAVTVTASWSYNGGSSSGSSYNYYTITAAAGTGGSISPTGSTSVREGLDMTYTITPKDGYVLDDVTVDDVSVKNQLISNSYTFENVRKAHTIKATFVEESKVNPDIGADNPFTDVSESDWFFNDVMHVFQNSLMKGTSDTTFDPHSTTTRGMIVTILYRMEKEPTVTGDCPFDDVASGKYYEDAVTWAAANKIVDGYGNSEFGPEDPITREQMAAIMYRYAAFNGYDVSKAANLDAYTDADSISGYALAPMKWANANGIVNGDGNQLMPAGNAERCQAAAIIYRFYKLFA